MSLSRGAVPGAESLPTALPAAVKEGLISVLTANSAVERLQSELESEKKEGLKAQEGLSGGNKEEKNSDSELLLELYQEELGACEEGLEDETASFLEHTLLPHYQETVLKLDTGQGCVIEIRPGSGGQEASIFASELFDMYENLSDRHGWTFRRLDEKDGLWQASIDGDLSYRRLQLESGVHRVQRVPSTEKAGRIQTSSASVVVLPHAREIDLQGTSLKQIERESEVFVKRGSGPGGQSVNNSCSAVRINHGPTGLWVNMMIHSSQLQNKQAGLELLRTKIYNQEVQAQSSERKNMRKSQVNTGDRSEKIRTYNFQRDSLVDHRFDHESVGAQESLYDSGLGQGLDLVLSAGMEDNEVKELADSVEWLDGLEAGWKD